MRFRFLLESTKTLTMASKKTQQSHLPPVIERLRRSQSTFFVPMTFNTCVSFLLGFNSAQEGGLLFGFREWLIVKLGEELNAAWPAFIIKLALRSGRTSFDPDEQSEENVAYLLDTLDTFLAERSTYTGARAIFLRYDDWLRTQEHYDEDSPIWVPRQEDLAKKPRRTKAPPRRAKASSRK